MVIKDPRAVWFLIALLMASSGCASTEEYSRFAQAGIVYTAALDRLLVATNHIAIDATSEWLLQDDETVNVSLENYQEYSGNDRKRLVIINDLRAHGRLLGRYFSLLNELATSNAPERAQQAIGGTVEGLNSLGKQLQAKGGDFGLNREALTSVTRVAVGVAIRGLLRDELEKRKDTIQLELKIQEELLKVLARNIKSYLESINERRERRLVINPLIAPAPISNPDVWIANRRMVLTSKAMATELDAASDAAQKLREAFEDLIAGRLSLGRINTLLTELESLLAVVETLNL